MKITTAQLRQIIAEEIRKITEVSPKDYEKVYSTHDAGVHGSYMKLSRGGRNKVTIDALAQDLKKDVKDLEKPGFFDGTGLHVVNRIVSQMI